MTRAAVISVHDAGSADAVVERLREAGQWSEGDPPILIVFDAGYDI